MEACREKNLCYNYDEHYTVTYTCAKKQLSMLVNDDDKSKNAFLEELPTTFATADELPPNMIVSLQVVLGLKNHHTLRLTWQFHGEEFILLVASGSAHTCWTRAQPSV